MILCINYGTPDFKNSQILNSKSAIQRGCADKVVSYSPLDLDQDFVKKNKDILCHKIGGGYWIWKPYIICKALESISEGDYLCYSDSGSFFVNKISYLIDSMNASKVDIMPFILTHKESSYTKRDAFVVMKCDKKAFYDTPQVCATYVLIKKTPYSIKFCKEWLALCQDPRLITNDPNVMGKDNYRDFKAHRNDQSILSLLCKKEKIPMFRDPSQYGLGKECFPDDVVKRSTYPQILNSHRNKNLRFYFQIEEGILHSIYLILKRLSKVRKIFYYVCKK